MKKKYFRAMNEMLQPFFHIRYKFDQQNITAGDVKQILGITKMQLSYWDAKGLKLSRKRAGKRAWRKFSIFDLFGFAILLKLRNFGFRLDKCESVFTWIRDNIYDLPFFIYHTSFLLF